MSSALALPLALPVPVPLPLSAAKYNPPYLTLIEGGAGLRSAIASNLSVLHRRALKLARKADAASDLVHDTIERALRFESQFEKGTNLIAWLYTVMYNVFVTGFRRNKRARNVERAAAVDPCSYFRPEYGVAVPADMRALPPALQDAVLGLQPAFQRVVLLVDVGELSYREAAVELGIPVGTVMSRLSRARRALRDALNGARRNETC